MVAKLAVERFDEAACEVALVDGRKKVGCILVERNGHLSTFWVDPLYRGQGWGGKLLEKAKEMGGKTLAAKPFGSSVSLNRMQLVAFYRRHGFEPIEGISEYAFAPVPMQLKS